MSKSVMGFLRVKFGKGNSACKILHNHFTCKNRDMDLNMRNRNRYFFLRVKIGIGISSYKNWHKDFYVSKFVQGLLRVKASLLIFFSTCKNQERGFYI